MGAIPVTCITEWPGVIKAESNMAGSVHDGAAESTLEDTLQLSFTMSSFLDIFRFMRRQVVGECAFGENYVTFHHLYHTCCQNAITQWLSANLQPLETIILFSGHYVCCWLLGSNWKKLLQHWQRKAALLLLPTEHFRLLLDTPAHKIACFPGDPAPT